MKRVAVKACGKRFPPLSFCLTDFFYAVTIRSKRELYSYVDVIKRLKL